MASSMVIQDISPWTSDPGWNFCLQHLKASSDQSGSPKLYLWIALGLLGLNSCLQLATMLYQNRPFAGRSASMAITSFTLRNSKENIITVTATQICILLPWPMQIEAGQYINLWIPLVGLWSWAQIHPFTVTSWSQGRQDSMEFFVQPCCCLSVDLICHAPVATESLVSFLALFTGLHGTSEYVSQYKSTLSIASGFGVAAAIPYLKKMIYSYNTCTLQARWFHLVWQVE